METISKTRKGSLGLRQTVRAKGLGKGKTKKRTACPHRIAFLAQKFYPLLSKEHSELSDVKEITKGFYTSLENLCSCYGIVAERYKDLPYPLNIGKCFNVVSKSLEKLDSSVELRFLQDQKGKARLATVHSFSNGNTLFYLPTEIVFHLMANDLPTADLLLSVYSYLFRYVGIAHYGEKYSYLGGIYEMIEEMYLQEEDPDRDEEYYSYIIGHLEFIREQGAVCVAMLNEVAHVKEFEDRAKNYRPKNKMRRDFLQTARGFLKLFQEFPKRNIHDRICPLANDDDYNDSVIRVEQYLHFFWDFDCPVKQELMDYVNAELNECGQMEEPTTFQYFDIPQDGAHHEHDFEKRLCELLHELTDNLIDLKK
ncbi:MAG: hypothetical protein EOO88_24770 [Pedobacter sp.]|nr:MAG: hypothetical protein EOO88_24770 [Pedobacter sp.]